MSFPLEYSATTGVVTAVDDRGRKHRCKTETVRHKGNVYEVARHPLEWSEILEIFNRSNGAEDFIKRIDSKIIDDDGEDGDVNDEL